MTVRLVTVAVALSVITFAAQSKEPTASQLGWLQTNAIPIRYVEAETGFADLQRLKAAIGDARIVALGEATHGTREINQLRHRLTEFLASELGFTVVGLETMDDADPVNEYVLHGTGDPKTMFGDWILGTGEVFSLIEWMRRFNLSGKGRLQFAGFDLRKPHTAAQEVEDFLRLADPPQVKESRDVLGDAVVLEPPPRTFVVTTGTFPARVAGSRSIKFSGAVRTRELDGYAGLCWRAEGKKGVMAYAMQSDAPHGTTDWRRHEIALDVPRETETIAVGVLMRGRGAAWFDDLRVEIDGHTYSTRAFDSDFESGSLKRSPAPMPGYAVTIDRTTAARGTRSLRVESQRTAAETGTEQTAAQVSRRLRRLVAHMESSRESYLTKRDGRTVERAIQNARAVQQYAEWAAGEASRDESMARNVRRTLDAATSGARIVLWAHNDHIGRIKAGYRRMGGYLDEWYGRDYIPIGSSVERGEYLAYGSAGVGRHRLTPAEPGSYEHVFARAAMPRFVVDLRAARSSDPASAWLRATMQFRSIGALAADQQFVSSNLAEMFDLVVFLAETTPTSYRR